MKSIRVLSAGAILCLAAAAASVAGTSGSSSAGHAFDLIPRDTGSGSQPVEETADVEGPDGGISPRGTVSHQVNVKVVADGAYRDAHPAWRERIEDTIERADNKLYDVFDINLNITEVDTWASATSSSCQPQLDDLRNVDRNGRDLVIGFTGKNITDAGGCAYRLGRYTVVVDQGLRADWIVTRHEVSHLFGAFDRYLANGAANPNHNDDLMELPYDHPGWWSAEEGDGDRPIIRDHAGRFDG